MYTNIISYQYESKYNILVFNVFTGNIVLQQMYVDIEFPLNHSSVYPQFRLPLVQITLIVQCTVVISLSTKISTGADLVNPRMGYVKSTIALFQKSTTRSTFYHSLTTEGAKKKQNRVGEDCSGTFCRPSKKKEGFDLNIEELQKTAKERKQHLKNTTNAQRSGRRGRDKDSRERQRPPRRRGAPTPSELFK